MSIKREPHCLQMGEPPFNIRSAKATYFDALVVQLQAIPNAAREHLADLRAISCLLATALHPAFLVYDAALDDTVANRLTNDVLGVLLRVEMQFDAYIAQRDTGVRKRETADACFNYVLPEPRDERVSLISLEASRVRRKCRLELRKRAGADR
jgi:hypothetical protein